MKKTLVSLMAATVLSGLGAVSATEENYDIYAVAEIGSIKNFMDLSGDLTSLTPNNQSGITLGASAGVRYFTEKNWIFGVEASLATAEGSSSVSDAVTTLAFKSDYISGAYFTFGKAFGDSRRIKLYGLLGAGSTSGDISATIASVTETEKDNGSGLSYGAAFEVRLKDSLGVRAKIVRTKYKGDIDEIKIGDTMLMAGVVYTF